jgi:DNA-binding CsgD family transcriptional regulator
MQNIAKQHIADDHFVFKAMPAIIKLSEKLSKESNIYFLTYNKIYDDGSVSEFATRKDWGRHFYDIYLNISTLLPRINSGINYWKCNKSQQITEMAEDARKNFDIDARIELVHRDDIQNCYHMYSFFSNRKNANKAYKFYTLHCDKLLKFIAYFNKMALALLIEGDKLENRFFIPNYTKPKKKANLFIENATLTNGEFKTMLLYASGCTSKQIAKILTLSSRTVENYMVQVWYKTNCKDRMSLYCYVRDRGWLGLENFFYSPSKKTTNEAKENI